MDALDSILKMISRTNNHFKTDFTLVGSWVEKGYSLNDIDLTTDLKDDVVIEAAQHIAIETGLVVDIFPSFGRGLYRNFLVYPSGKHGWSHDLVMDELILAGIVGMQCDHCGYTWNAKGALTIPKTCPSCHEVLSCDEEEA